MIHFVLFDAAKYYVLASVFFVLGWAAKGFMVEANRAINAQQERDSVRSYANLRHSLAPGSSAASRSRSNLGHGPGNPAEQQRRAPLRFGAGAPGVSPRSIP